MSEAVFIVNLKFKKGLQQAFKSVIMPLTSITKGVVMLDQNENLLTQEEREAVMDPISNPEGFISLWEKAGARAVQKATEENARLGINSPCTRNGQTGYLTPKGHFIASEFTPK